VTQPRYLADENVPFRTVSRLAESGVDIQSVSVVLPGELDEDVLAYATRNGQVVISFDKDFGRLVFVERMVPAGCRPAQIRTTDPGACHDVMSRLLTSGISLCRSLHGRHDRRVRSVPLPKQ